MTDPRTRTRLKEHYRIEKELAERLRSASPERRRELYSSLYEELFRRVPDHPQLIEKKSPEQQSASIARRMNLIRDLLSGDTSFLEIGPGDCSLAFEVAKKVRQVIAVDVSETISRQHHLPDNFHLVLSDGCSVPVPENSIDLAYSNQLMEHLHPDDSLEQLKNIYTALAPGGCYICITPNRLNGPHDISRYFDQEATGFHLKEYTVKELAGLFRAIGFRRIFCYVGGRGRYFKVSPLLPILVENLLETLPSPIRRKIADLMVIRAMINIRLLGVK